MPPVATGLMLVWLFGRRGPAGGLLARLGIDVLFTWRAIVIAMAVMGLPLLVGLSRKSLIGKLIGRGVEQRLPASLALALLAVERGAGIIRTHDVAATVDAVAMWVALQELPENE